jgi:hypothetical protein
MVFRRHHRNVHLLQKSFETIGIWDFSPSRTIYGTVLINTAHTRVLN